MLRVFPYIVALLRLLVASVCGQDLRELAQSKLQRVYRLAWRSELCHCDSTLYVYPCQFWVFSGTQV